MKGHLCEYKYQLTKPRMIQSKLFPDHCPSTPSPIFYQDKEENEIVYFRVDTILYQIVYHDYNFIPFRSTNIELNQPAQSQMKSNSIHKS